MIIGLILHYSPLNNVGVVIDENSVRYNFSDDLWQEDTTLQCGMKIYFLLNATNEIIKIYQANRVSY